MRHLTWLLILLLAGVALAASPVVCIDPGHPSEINAGRTVQNGLREVEINWAVAQALAAALRKQDVTVVMTKSRQDAYVTNRRRAEIANAAGAALMVRLHCDTGAGNGYALYYPDGQGTVQGRTGPSAAMRAASKLAAEAIHAGMTASPTGTLRDDGVRGESATAVGHRQGALTGSIFSKVPAVTIEMAVLSHHGDAAYIRQPENQVQLATAIAAGIQRFLATRR